MNKLVNFTAAISALGVAACASPKVAVLQEREVTHQPPINQETEYIYVVPETLGLLFREAMRTMKLIPSPDSQYPITTCEYVDSFGFDQIFRVSWAIVLNATLIKQPGNMKLFIRSSIKTTLGAEKVMSKYAFPYDKAPYTFFSSQQPTEARLQEILQGIVDNCSLEVRS